MLEYMIVCLFSMSAAKMALQSPQVFELEDAELYFETFIQRYGKHYADEKERQARFEIFKDNLEEVNQLNNRHSDAVFDLTMFMDLTHEEFLQQYTGYGQNYIYLHYCTYVFEQELQYVQVPDTFDWRQYNVVTPVKNQNGCGSCYAFSALANIETQYAIKYGHHVDLAEQQIVDCDTTNNGCNAGYMTNVFLYLIQAGGVMSEHDYIYRSSRGACQFDQCKAAVRVADCRSYFLVTQERLKQLLYTTGPLSVGIQSSGLKTYNGGLITDESCNVGPINHAVLLVGYGYWYDVPIWIGKNSWGTDWGDQGYFYFIRGDHAHSCGMMQQQISSAILA